jgi:hypothetical protein
MKHVRWILLLLALVISCSGGVWLYQINLGPLAQEKMATPRIYAYRSWQSVGIQVNPGDVIHIRARGRWLYTPGETHGPEGHARYPAPNTYPIAGGNIPGGVLLARIGEQGRPQLVGRGRMLIADRSGTLYFRINDDILSDNEGYVTVEVTVEPPASNAPASSRRSRLQPVMMPEVMPEVVPEWVSEIP